MAIAANFPNTTPVTDTGAVSNSWSVRFFRSSARERMVSRGTTRMSRKDAAFSAVANPGVPWYRL